MKLKEKQICAVLFKEKLSCNEWGKLLFIGRESIWLQKKRVRRNREHRDIEEPESTYIFFGFITCKVEPRSGFSFQRWNSTMCWGTKGQGNVIWKKKKLLPSVAGKITMVPGSTSVCQWTSHWSNTAGARISGSTNFFFWIDWREVSKRTKKKEKTNSFICHLIRWAHVILWQPMKLHWFTLRQVIHAAPYPLTCRIKVPTAGPHCPATHNTSGLEITLSYLFQRHQCMSSEKNVRKQEG